MFDTIAQDALVICMCDATKPGGPFDNSSTRGIFVVVFLYIFLTNIQILYNILQEFDVQLFYTFTCQYILKLDYSNIFYKNTSQGHNPAFLILPA